ncbi:MAG TPA: GntG family PLP-dependent aldolase [Acidimicrobiia bacterium]|nr:GntG family PLP-dependent aldolase [Acidimicrobiia bacterium]
MIDLRSDTVTQPTAGMRRAIAEAEVGDDVYHDDPTVLALEARVAELLGKDDAMYVPTGTMSNQVALRTHTEPGDVVLAAEEAHIHVHELGAPYALSGVTLQFLPSDNGQFATDAVHEAVPEIPKSMPSSLFQPVTLLCTENTHNAAGGTFWERRALDAVAGAAHDLGLATHMDGARLWNAAVAGGEALADLAAGFDTVSVCFSKGLGAPMGSALVGRQDLITRARRFKQMFGGGFRQAGMMAAGALYAVDHHIERLAEDHANAARLAAGLAEIPGIDVDPETVATNMVYCDVTAMAANPFAERCSAAGVHMLPMSAASIRAVTNLHVTAADIDLALGIIRDVLAQR